MLWKNLQELELPNTYWNKTIEQPDIYPTQTSDLHDSLTSKKVHLKFSKHILFVVQSAMEREIA